VTVSHRDNDRPVVLLDRDGVLNVDRRESVTSIAQLRLLPRVRDAVRRLHERGYALLVVTNQSWVGRERIPVERLEEINAELDRRLGGLVDDWFVCAHAPEDGCRCRKPDTALLEAAERAWGFDRAVTWLVGDDDRDVEASRRFGCRAALVRTGKGSRVARDRDDVPVFDDLAGFADWLLAAAPPVGPGPSRQQPT